MAVNWLELAAPNSTVPLDNYALVLNNQFNYTGGMVYEAENTFTVEFMVKPKVAHQIDVESTSGTGGTDGQKYVMFPVQGGSEADSRAGMGISVGTNGVSVYEHADYYMPALLVWAYPIDTVWTHVAVVYHNGKPSLYINGVWKKDGLQSLKQHVYPGTMFPGGYYGSQGDGILDEVRIWSVARTPAQIAANKDGELTGPQTGLVGYWPMNEGTGLVLHDVSGSGRDVDLTSAGYTSASWTNGRYSVASIVGSYRYAFNGKEIDKDIGEDDYDYGARIYDARIGKFLSTDPLTQDYPWYTPYQFAGNSPIAAIDLDGNEPKWMVDLFDKLTPFAFKRSDLVTAGFRNKVHEKVAGNEKYDEAKHKKLFFKVLGKIFEDVVLRSMGKKPNYSPYYPNPANRSYKFVPDAIQDGSLVIVVSSMSYVNTFHKIFPESVITEVKSTGLVRFDPDYNKEQFTKMIDYLSNVKNADGEKASDFGAAALFLVTPALSTIDPEIIKYATEKNVRLYLQWTMKDPQDKDKLKVIPTATALNTVEEKFAGAKAMESKTPTSTTNPTTTESINYNVGTKSK